MIHQLPQYRMQHAGVHEMLNRFADSGIDHVVAGFGLARMEGGADVEDCRHAVNNALAT